MDLTQENIKTQAGLLLDKISANIGTNESEKLYYQTLALKELNLLQSGQAGLPGEGLLKLLSPVHGTAKSTDSTIKGSQYTTHHPSLLWNDSNEHGWYCNGVVPRWCVLKLQKVSTLHRYTIINGPHNSVGRPSAWEIQVSLDESYSESGMSWQLLDEQTVTNPAIQTTYSFDIKPEKLNHTCWWIKIIIKAWYDPSGGGNDAALRSIEYWGKEVA